jgi:hypothetical protein
MNIQNKLQRKVSGTVHRKYPRSFATIIRSLAFVLRFEDRDGFISKFPGDNSVVFGYLIMSSLETFESHLRLQALEQLDSASRPTTSAVPASSRTVKFLSTTVRVGRKLNRLSSLQGRRSPNRASPPRPLSPPSHRFREREAPAVGNLLLLSFPSY